MPVRYSNLKLRARLLVGDEPGWLQRHSRRAYLVALILATPPWYNRAEVARLSREARQRTLRTGRPHVLDHVIPITHKRVCGLNVQNNLQITDAAVNARKSNHWCEWHGELFAEPEQFKLL